MQTDHRNCPECGARLKADATQCDLCGLPLSGGSSQGASLGTSPQTAQETSATAPEAGTPRQLEAIEAAMRALADEEDHQGPSARVFCHSCGWRCPPGARFCSRCGTRLDVPEGAPVPPVPPLLASPPPPPSSISEPATPPVKAGPAAGVSPKPEPVTPSKPAPEPTLRPTPPAAAKPAEPPPSKPTPKKDRAPGKDRVRVADKAPVEKSGGKIGTHIAVIIGSGVLLVAALYMITTMSKTMEGTPSATAPPQEAVLSAPASPPLPTTITNQADSLETEIAALEGAARTEKRRELVDLYLQAGRYDLAGNTQTLIAEEVDTEEAWVLVGNLYYDWMEGLNGQDRSYYAQQAIAGYQRALALNPDNLDVRTDMAIAYLYDPQNPMQAIQQTNLVLEKDPDHIQANFNRGIMLMQINRLDEAIDQFQRVKTLIGDTNDGVYQRADAAIEAVRKMQGG